MNNKKLLQQKVLSLLKKKLQSSKKGVADFELLDKKFDTVLAKLSERMSTQLLTKVAPSVLVENLEQVIKELKKEGMPITNFPKSIEIIQKKPEWYVAPSKQVEVKSLPAVEVKNVVKIATDIAPFTELMSVFFGNIVEFFTKLSNRTFSVLLPKEHYITPQFVLMLDPKTMKPVSPKDIGSGTFNQFVSQGIASGPRNVGVRGANTINDGTTTITTAGTRVQLPNVQCSRVYIQSAPSNAGEVVVGGENVVAATGTRRGLSLFSSQWQSFEVDNLNRLYVDSTASGDKINYIYEYFA